MADIVHFRTGQPLSEQDTPMHWQCQCGSTQMRLVTTRNEQAAQENPRMQCSVCKTTMGGTTGSFVESEG